MGNIIEKKITQTYLHTTYHKSGTFHKFRKCVSQYQ